MGVIFGESLSLLILTFNYLFGRTQLKDDDDDDEDRDLLSDNTVESTMKNGRIFKGSQVAGDDFNGSTRNGISVHIIITMGLVSSSFLLGNVYDWLSNLLSKGYVIRS